MRLQAIPGLTTFAIAVKVSTNGVSYTSGRFDLAQQTVETAQGDVLAPWQIRRIRCDGRGTWTPPGDEARAAVLVLAMLGGMPVRQLHELAGITEQARERSGRSRKVTMEIPSGFTPAAAASSVMAFEGEAVGGE